eukprot:m.221086 g.221086  ORF g.221086 m.221086 type:complete len:669 (+) comp39954_c1_seq15:519-2525(+)
MYEPLSSSEDEKCCHFKAIGDSAANAIVIGHSDSSLEVSPQRKRPKTTPIRSFQHALFLGSEERKSDISDEEEESGIAELQYLSSKAKGKRWEKNLGSEFEISSQTDCEPLSGSESQRDFYNGDEKLPVFAWGCSANQFSVKELADILIGQEVDPAKISTAQPVGVNHNAAFLVDLSCLRSVDDLKADDLGVWNAVGVPSRLVMTEEKEGMLHVNVMPSGLKLKDAETSKRSSTLRLTRTYYRHGQEKDFHRIITAVKDPTGAPLRFAMVQYYFDGEEHSVKVAPHGNSRRHTRPFRRAMKSTLDCLKEEVELHGGEKARMRVNESKGGLVQARSSGELVRDRKQAYNAHNKRRGGVGTGARATTDPYMALLHKCSSTASNKEIAFVRRVELAPEPRIFLATDLQLNLLEKFCIDSEQFTILTADPTFNCGNFDLTCVTFKNLTMSSRRDQANPLMIGPMMIHHRKLYDSYSFLFTSLVTARPALKNLQAFGTDGANLVRAMSHAFPQAEQLRCFLHVRRNLKDKLNRLDLPPGVIQEILHDIFGDSLKTDESLVDSPNDELFNERLLSLKGKWDSLEQKHGRPNQACEFYLWFEKYQSETFRKHMITPVRTRAGMGKNPSPFYTNTSESLNALIQWQIEHQKKPVDEFVSLMEELVKNQEEKSRKLS